MKFQTAIGIVSIFFCSAFLQAEASVAQSQLWRELYREELPDSLLDSEQREDTLAIRYLSVDHAALHKVIDNGLSSFGKSFSIELPLPTGGFQTFEFREAITISAGLAEKFPHIKAYSGRSTGKTQSTAQMEITVSGISVQILDPHGRWVIDPIDRTDTSKVKSYFPRGDQRQRKPFQCDVDHADLVNEKESNQSSLVKMKNRRTSAGRSRETGTELRTYRLAIATTGEYGQYHGGTADDVLSAVVRVVNRINGIFNGELSVGFELVENVDEILFTDPDTDPFEGDGDNEILIDESQRVIDETIGEANYDIGHTFSSSGGGLAGTGPCQDGFKASGVTGGTEGEYFIVDYVAHEIGHQFSMSHTFNSNADNCLDNRVGRAAFEPGAGSTIMSYNGNCFPDNITQSHLPTNYSDPMFHSFSFEQAANYIESYGSVCGTASATGNSFPLVDAGSHYTVPASTPLIMEGNGSDPDGHEVTYSWEQRDLGPAASLSAPDDGSIPLFRTFAPVATSSRYLPQLSTIVSGEMDNTEKLPRVGRTMNMVLTARDQIGGRNSASTEIQVAPQPLVGKTFSVAEPNMGGELGRVGTVRWNVGDTDSAPISVSEVDLYLSTDGGANFASLPFATVENNGYARVTFPAGIDTDSARLMIRGRGNIFLDVSDHNFSLNSSAAATPEVPAPINALASAASASNIEVSFEPGANSGVTYHEAACIGEPNYSSFSESQAPNSNFDDTMPISSSIELDNDGVVAPEGLLVSVDISHTYRGDVVIALHAPSGRKALLKTNDWSDNAQDVVETYTIFGFNGEDVSGEWILEVSDYYTGDEGTLNSWGISGSGITAPRIVQGSAAPDLYFDDASPISASIQLTEEGEVSIDEFEVAVDISHTWRSDVVIELESPSGKRITLRQADEDDSGDDVKGVYPSTLQSLTPFSELAGESLTGTWTLHISDQYSQDSGVLNSWGINQEQYVFAGRNDISPIEISGLPTNKSYSCDIWGVYSGDLPSRQSRSKSAGSVVLGSAPREDSAPTRFINLLQSTRSQRSLEASATGLVPNLEMGLMGDTPEVSRSID